MERMKRDIVSIIILLASLAVNGQEGIPFPDRDLTELYDSISKLQISWMNNLYLQKTGFAREIVDGKEYFPYYYRSRSKPILRLDEERSALLIIHGSTFNHLILQYDTFTDEIIYSDDSLIFNNQICKIALNKDEISCFDLCFNRDTLHFRYFGKDRDTSFNLEEGFYEVVYDKETKYLIRHVSSGYLTIDKNKEYLYEPVNYIKVFNGFSRITSTKQFIALFGKRSDDIRHFLRQKKIRILRADKKQITEVLNYYEALQSRES